MRLIEILFSPTGGTKKVSDIITSQFDGEKIAIDMMGNVFDSEIEICPDDICVIAVPSFGGRVPEPARERMATLSGNGAKTAIVVAYGNRAIDDTLLELKNIAEAAGFKCIAALSAVAEHSIMRQFGKGRPDASDKIELEAFGKKFFEMTKEEWNDSELEVPGNYPYRQFGGLPLKPVASSKCNKCGACVKRCPTGAISFSEHKHTDKGKRITCMACVSICPRKARKISRLPLMVAGNKMKKVCAGRKENSSYFAKK